MKTKPNRIGYAQIGRVNPGYPKNKNIMPISDEEDAANAQYLKSVFGDMDEEEYEDYRARCAERWQKRKDEGLKKAKAMLRQMDRPVCRRDMLTAMETAVMRQIKRFETMETPPEAVALIALVICRNILADGPLHEGA